MCLKNARGRKEPRFLWQPRSLPVAMAMAGQFTVGSRDAFVRNGSLRSKHTTSSHISASVIWIFFY